MDEFKTLAIEKVTQMLVDALSWQVYKKVPCANKNEQAKLGRRALIDILGEEGKLWCNEADIPHSSVRAIFDMSIEEKKRRLDVLQLRDSEEEIYE